MKNKLDTAKVSMNKKDEKYLVNFTNNMNEGIMYYQDLFDNLKTTFENTKLGILQELKNKSIALDVIKLEIDSLINHQRALI